MMDKICHADVFAVGFSNLRECALEITNIPTQDDIFAVELGTPLTIHFRYITGNPPAFSFGVLFYPTFTDAIKLRNPLVRQLPDFTIHPTVPQPDTGDWQQGSVRIEFAEDHPTDGSVSEFYFGVLIMNAPNHSEEEAA